MALICVKKFIDINEAEIAKSFLKDNDIEATVFKEGITSAYPIYGFADIKLMVREEDKEKALRLLKEVR